MPQEMLHARSNDGLSGSLRQGAMDEASSIRGAFEAYVAAVKNGTFPDDSLHAW